MKYFLAGAESRPWVLGAYLFHSASDIEGQNDTLYGRRNIRESESTVEQGSEADKEPP